MKPSEINERNDQVTAWMVTIIVHLAVIAALFFVAFPQAENSRPTQNSSIENQAVPQTGKVKPKA
ncbi:MAG: hypothetical protein SH818_05605 [Saprospiraceae bacterium]|nr:hypothetical protein [Saprospiraceae bacterium]